MTTADERQQMVIAKRRQEAARLYLRGHTQTAIAERLGCAQSTVSEDLKGVRQEWLESALLDIDAAKAQELAKIDQLELEYWLAWDRSVGPHVQETEELDGETLKLKTVTEKLAGDPRFLAGVERCIERRCKILGLDAPAKSDDTVRTVPYLEREVGEAV